MANSKITALTELTTVADEDLVAIVDDPSGTPTSKKITKANLVKNIAVSDLANGTDGELITWNSSGVASAVPVGTATNVLTSNGTGQAPTFQAVSGGVANPMTSTLDCDDFKLQDVGRLNFSEVQNITPSSDKLLSVTRSQVRINSSSSTYNVDGQTGVGVGDILFLKTGNSNQDATIVASQVIY